MLEAPDTTSLTTVEIDLTAYTEFEDESCSDSDNSSDTSRNEYERSRLKCNGLLVPFRKELARIVLSNKRTKNVYNGKIGMKSGLYFLNKGRKAATEITSSSQVVDWILKNTKRVIGCDNDDSDTNNMHAQIYISFGSVNEFTDNPIQYFEEDVIEVHGSTPCHLETVEPVDELDKKVEAKKTKQYPTIIRTLFRKVFSDEDNPFHYGFTTEMMSAAVQVMLSETKAAETIDKYLSVYPPPAEFFNKCKESCAIQKHLKYFKWEKGKYPPTNELDEPPQQDMETELRSHPHAGKEIQMIMSQVEVNREILSMIARAKTTLIFVSMMSHLTSPELVTALIESAARGVDVNIFHSFNPYVPAPTNDEIENLFHKASISFTSIPMHGKRLPNFLSTLMSHGSYVNPFRTNVTHTRFICNDAECMFGGVDFNKTCEAENYVQHTIKFSLLDDSLNNKTALTGMKLQIKELITELKVTGNLYNYIPSTVSPSIHIVGSSIIATSAVDSSAYNAIIDSIQSAKHYIFIENQYFEHKKVLFAIAQKKLKTPSIQVVLVGNYQFHLNPYHPGKYYFCTNSILNYILRKETINGLIYLMEEGCDFEFRTYRNKYTHNKIFIIDHGRTMIVGTFNLHKRSLDAGNDCEIGVVLKDNSATSSRNAVMDIASSYIESVMKDTELINPDLLRKKRILNLNYKKND
mmetsp:Transcript_5384/g.6065  ORF Transcript_5384/g.6065 Transcript_5384/m.6065 type:complete len:692 (+) Transcript_5384:206-2281(+)